MSFIDWLNGGNDEGEAGARQIASLPAEERDAHLERNPDVMSWHCASALLALCRDARRDDDLQQALGISHFLTRNAHSMRVPEEYAHLAELERAAIWIEHGDVLRVLGEPAGAVDAYERSLTFSPNADEHGAVRARVHRAGALHELGRSFEALPILYDDLPLLREYHPYEAVEALLEIATIERALGRRARMRAALDEAKCLAPCLANGELTARVEERRVALIGE